MNSVENILKYLDYLGRDVFVIDAHSIPGYSYIKTVQITSMEVYSEGVIRLKSHNEGSFYPSYETQFLFLNREDAEKEMNRRYGPNVLDLTVIKQCPKCKGTADVMTSDSSYFIKCHDCGIQTKSFSKLRDAIDNWNERK